MRRRPRPPALLVAALMMVTPACSGSSGPPGPDGAGGATSMPATPVGSTDPGPPAERPGPGSPSAPGVYSAAGAGMIAPAVAGDPARVYVPNSETGTVSVIDPATFKVIDTFTTGTTAQHVVPSWDLRTLWVNNNGGSLTPIDPATGRPGPTVPVRDPYNMYFTPDGQYMIVVAEALEFLDFRDPHTTELHDSVPVPCKGVNHIDFSADGRYFLATCEFEGSLIKVDTASHQVVGQLDLGGANRSQPQDVRLVPSGRFFYVADMVADGVHVIDGDTFRKIGFVPTGPGAHGMYPSRDGTRMYVADRGTNTVSGRSRPPGDVAVLDPEAGELGSVVAHWSVPGGGSPDMGNVSADGRQLWLSGRYDGEVYCFDTASGALLARIPVGKGPHGLTVWPQPGRYSLGHTGNMR